MSEAKPAVRVVVADDQRVVREGLVTVLEILANVLAQLGALVPRDRAAEFCGQTADGLGNGGVHGLGGPALGQV